MVQDFKLIQNDAYDFFILFWGLPIIPSCQSVNNLFSFMVKDPNDIAQLN